MSEINNTSNNKKKNIEILTLSALILLLLIVIAGTAYAKFVATANGTASAQVARLICNMNVTPCDPTDTEIINPYCTVTLKDFTAEDNTEKITEASLRYTVSVSMNSNSSLATLPAYHWENATTGQSVGTPSQPLTGTFTKGNKETQVYKVVFDNAGTEVTAQIDFDLTAIQQSNN